MKEPTYEETARVDPDGFSQEIEISPLARTTLPDRERMFKAHGSARREQPMALKWRQLLREHLRHHRIPNGSSVAAVAGELVTYANPDGTNVYPSQETIGEGTQLHRNTVAKALKWLQAGGWIAHVGNLPANRGEGVKIYRLTIPAALIEEPDQDDPDDVTVEPLAQPLAQPLAHSEGTTSATSDLPQRAASSHSRKRLPKRTPRRPEAVTEEEWPVYLAWLRKRAAEKHDRGGLIHKMAPEDVGLWRDELQASRDRRPPTTTAEARTEGSPERNDPAECLHRAVTDFGWCAACSTDVSELIEP